MIPLFKSHYSIGKSILTLNHPDKCEEDGSDSIFKITSGHLNKIVLVEDSLVGFLQAQKTAESLGVQLVFGLRLRCRHEKSSDDSNCIHKIILFAKNDSGCKLLNKIYSQAFCEHEGVIDFNSLKKLWDIDSLMMSIPFYDSFIFMNALHFCNCIPDFSFSKPHFFIEDNHLPFDHYIADKVKNYCSESNFEYSTAKSIYYNKVADFEAYQTYKCICSKKFKQRTLNVPNFDHLASPEFSFESYLQHESA